MLQSITQILQLCGSIESVLPPTELFNEGRLLRLVLDWLDRHRDVIHTLSFISDARWYSEALLPSRFHARTKYDSQAESYTHADGVIGHFTTTTGNRGFVQLLPGVTQFVVIEAKLGSPLSPGTTNAPTFDQAARNVACIAHMLDKAGVEPTTVKNLAFYVIAPDSQIKAGGIRDLVTKESVKKKVQARVSAYGGAHDAWFETCFLPTLGHIEINALAWETILADLPNDPEVTLIKQFYAECLRFNPASIKH